MNAIICSFGSSVEDLKGKQRTPENVLQVLKKNPRISTFTMSEHYRWLPKAIEQLEATGRIERLEEPYPWHKWKVIEQ